MMAYTVAQMSTPKDNNDDDNKLKNRGQLKFFQQAALWKLFRFSSFRHSHENTFRHPYNPRFTRKM